MAVSPQPFSMRLGAGTLANLERQARQRGESKTRVGERLLEEGLRMAEHPGVVFRDGPAGRRPALAAGPDVWEVIETLQQVEGTGEEAIATAATWASLTPAQVRVAMRYYGDFAEEVDGWIRENREEADRQQAAWRRAQDALR
ncbi:MAG TPA: hypothetical protein VKB25_06585 [Conexibacter sp.]|nr:hypothetical protein [Conexibacter sp.]